MLFVSLNDWTDHTNFLTGTIRAELSHFLSSSVGNESRRKKKILPRSNREGIQYFITFVCLTITINITNPKLSQESNFNNFKFKTHWLYLSHNNQLIEFQWMTVINLFSTDICVTEELTFQEWTMWQCFKHSNNQWV